MPHGQSMTVHPLIHSTGHVIRNLFIGGPSVMGKYRTGRYPMQVILEHLGDLYYPCTTPAQNAEEGLASIVGCMMNPSYLGYWSTRERGYLNLRHKSKCIRPDGHSVNRERALARRSSQVCTFTALCVFSTAQGSRLASEDSPSFMQTAGP